MAWRSFLAPLCRPALSSVSSFRLGARRALCSEVSEESKAAVLDFLKAASREKMGLAKAKQSAGQKALDLTRLAKQFDDLDLPGLLRLKTADLKQRGVGVQERKRMLRYMAKANQGFVVKGKPYWRNWVDPMRVE